MFNKVEKARKLIIKEMTYQGKHYKQQELFFKELWEEMKNSFTEDNDTSLAAFIFERFLTVLPLENINKHIFESVVNEIYNDTPLDSQPYFAMYNAQGKWQPGWNPSTPDCLAEDWLTVE